MTENTSETAYTRATIHLRLEVATTADDADRVLGWLRETAAMLADDPEALGTGLDIAATGAATVTEGWYEGADGIVARAVELFPSPDFDDIASRISRVNTYGYTGDIEDLEALDPSDRATIEAREAGRR